MCSLFDEKIDCSCGKFDTIYLDLFNATPDNSTPENELLFKSKQRIEEQWKIYQPYSDINFKDQIKRDFYSRWWEMNLTLYLIDQGFNVVERENRNGTAGPDILIDDENKNIWIEAICPDSGCEPNKVFENRCYGMVNEIPNEKRILRYSCGIFDKYKKYIKYIENGVIGKDDVYIIAVNSSKIEDFPSLEVDDIVKSVYPIGYPVVTISRNDLKKIGEGYCFLNNRAKQKKDSKEVVNINTESFLDKRYCGLSGIFFSYADHVNWDNISPIFIHNVSSDNPLPLKFFSVYKEFCFDYVNHQLIILRR